MKTILRILTAIAVLFSTSATNAQKLNYKTDSGFDIGFGIGGSYQRSDIRNSTGGGFDFVFGHSIYQKEKAFFSLDWRFRFLAGQNIAFDDRINTDGTYSNVKYSHFNYDLEFALTLNRLRNRTGIILSGFAGLGLAHSRTKFDLENDDTGFLVGPAYDFSTINASGTDSQDKIYSDLLELSDGEFETPGINQVTITPTTGFYIGYQFTKHFSMGIEHKTNYFLSESKNFIGANIDGRINTGSPIDRNNYTSLIFRWDIGGGGSGGGTITTNTTNTTGYTEQKPRVDITDPHVAPHTTTLYTYTIKAKIYNVSGYENVKFYQDGVKNVNFTFNPDTRDFSADVVLHKGGNKFRVYGQNNAGSDEDNTTIIVVDEIIVDEPTPIPPVVNITVPQNNPHYTNANTQPITAEVLHVATKNDITVSVNGSAFTNFTFANNRVNFTTNLIEGNNMVVITGVNQYGSDSDDATIIYTKPAPQPTPPTVNITDPNVNPKTVDVSNYLVVAATTYIPAKANLTVKVNGITVNTNTFTFNQNNGLVKVNMPLVEGANTIEITGRNDYGQASDATTIIYKKPVTIIPPVVTIIIPDESPYRTYNGVEELTASVLNVKGKENITLTINGTNTREFTYDINTKLLKTNVVLNDGQNTIVVVGTNEAGKDDDSQIIIKEQKPCPQPTLTLAQPNTNYVETKDQVHDIRLTSTNATSVRVFYQNETYKNFSFNQHSGEITMEFPMVHGMNTIKVEAINECGIATQTLQYKYDHTKPCDAPVIMLQSSDAIVQDAAFNFQANVQNVTDRNEITVTLNGGNVLFNYNNGNVSANLTLVEGRNTITISAQNNCGQDSKTIVVTYTKPEEPCDEPTLSLVQPTANYVETKDQVHDIVLNSKNATSVKVFYQNETYKNFKFDTATGKITMEFPMVHGMNTIKVEAINDCGVATQTLQYKYDHIKPCDAPVIMLQSSDAIVQDAAFNFQANVQNVTDRNEVKVTLNSGNVLFNYNNGNVSANLTLVEGKNTITITAQNDCGQDSKTIAVTYTKLEEPCDAPVVAKQNTNTSVEDTNYNFEATIQNVEAKNQITLKVNGASASFNFNSGKVTANLTLAEGANTIVLSAQNDCGQDSKTLSVTYTKPKEPCYPPVINFTVTEVNRNDASHELSGTVTNIKNKTDITLTVDGKADNGFQFVPSTTELSTKFKLSAGTHTIIVTAKNECGEDSKTITVTVAEPCYPPVVNFTVTEVNRNDASHELKGTVTNIKNKTDITLTVDGKADNGFQFVPSTTELSTKFKLTPGTHTIIVTAKNECGEDSKTITVTIEEKACGPRINPGNSEWQFCLITPSGTFNRDNLASNGFTYSGSASSLFIMPIAGGGDAIVDGKPYVLKSGQYYLFEGNLTISVSTSHPGSMGHWSVCIDADKAPTTGNGNNRPKSPCEVDNDNGNNGNGGSNGGSGGQGGGNNGNSGNGQGENNNSGNQGGGNNNSDNNGNSENGQGGGNNSNGNGGENGQRSSSEQNNQQEAQQRQQEEAKRVEEEKRQQQIEIKKQEEAAARQREEAEKAKQEAEAKRKATEEARKKAAEDAAKKRAEAEAKRKAAEEEARKQHEEAERKNIEDQKEENTESETPKTTPQRTNTKPTPTKTEKPDSTKTTTPTRTPR